MKEKLADIRREYGRNPLLEDEAGMDPWAVFDRWFEQALASDVIEPTAMTLATVDAEGRPDLRTVLLKGIENENFIFYGGRASAKSEEIQHSPQVALNFYWAPYVRQVRVRGQATELDREEVEAYFASRPYESQLAANVAPQSSVLKDRAELEQRFDALRERLDEGKVPCPEHWTGYRVKPDSFEFFQGRDARLHDRLRYVRQGDSWDRERLAP